ncbi:MAG: HEPN domain-containing protein [Spirochaetaceae bacterium]|jgi:HEPN domain-containing protein|nr:HEPN domain-containing protein [Spirochaetaceae bacterium]
MVDQVFILEWLRYAMGDLLAARHMIEDMHPKQTEISAWHCQQCAEKALKAFLVANDIDPPKTHDLEKLNCFCQNIDDVFTEIQNDCQKINPYSEASHYPDGIAVDEIIAKTLVGRAQKVYDFCVSRINLLPQEETKG